MSEQEQDTPSIDPQNTWSTSFALMIRLRGSFSDEQLRLALARVRGQHPSLLQHQGEDGWMRPLPAENLPEFPLEVRTDCAEADWIDVASAELSRPFPPEGPMARFVLLRFMDGADLVAVFHHWVAEGMSGVYVIRDMLRLMADPTAELPPATIPPNVTDLIPQAVRRDSRTRARVWRELNRLRSSMSKNPPKDATSKPVFSEQELAMKREVCLLPASLSAEQTAALLARCRAEGTSVHAAICVAWLRAYAESLEGSRRWVRTASSPVNVRNRLAQPIPETSGGFVCIVNTRVNCAPSRDFWQVAREFKQRLAGGLEDYRLFVPELTMAKIPTSFPQSQLFHAFERYFSDGSNKYDFSMTNLGQVGIPPTAGTLKVEAFYGPLVNSMENERTVGVSTLDGKLTFTLLFRRALMDPVQGKQLIERVVELLGEAVGIR